MHTVANCRCWLIWYRSIETSKQRIVKATTAPTLRTPSDTLDGVLIDNIFSVNARAVQAICTGRIRSQKPAELFGNFKTVVDRHNTVYFSDAFLRHLLLKIAVHFAMKCDVPPLRFAAQVTLHKVGVVIDCFLNSIFQTYNRCIHTHRFLSGAAIFVCPVLERPRNPSMETIGEKMRPGEPRW